MNEILEKQDQLRVNISKLEKEFVDVIRDRLGIVVHHHQINDLYKTIIEACKKFKCTPEEYLVNIVNSDSTSATLDHLITGITIGETYFFRDKQQMKLLREKILPEMIKLKREKNQLSLRVWSAGCSSGEEIYSIAIMLCEMLDDIKHWNLSLLGSDINTVSLKKAMLSEYSEWAMRSISEEYKKKYFAQTNKSYLLSPEIKKLVNFKYINLSDNAFPLMFNGTNAQDLIICRNVLIYFDAETIAQLMKRLEKSLAQEGYLLLGASDPIITSGLNLDFHYKEGLYFTHVKDPKILKPENRRALPSQLEISKKPQLILPKANPPKLHTHTIENEQAFNQKITKLLNEGKWQEILTAVSMQKTINGKSESEFLLNAQATASANLGKLEEALQFCHENIRLYPQNPYTYYTLSLILSEMNNISEAVAALRKALFLDHQFVIGHYQLGLLLLRDKSESLGLKSLFNALKIAQSKNPQEKVPYFNDLDYGRLCDIFEKEIELHSLKKGG